MSISEMEDIKMWTCISALGVKPLFDGKVWRFSYRSLTEIVGTGHSIYEAARAFYTKVQGDS